MAITIDSVVLKLRNRLNDNRTDAGVLITSAATDGQLFTSAQLYDYVNQANVEMFRIFKKLAFAVNAPMNVKFDVFDSYIVSTALTPSTNPQEQTIACDFVLNVIQSSGNQQLNFIPFEEFNLSAYTGLTYDKAWTFYMLAGSAYIQLLNLISIAIKTFTVSSPTAKTTGQNLQLKDSHEDVLIDIALKNAMLDKNDVEKYNFYSQSVSQKIQSLF